MNWKELLEIPAHIIPFFLGYAEIHYNLKWLFPRYYRKEPEIVADLPIRCIRQRSASLPILLIAKDAHLFPIELKKINILIAGKDKQESSSIDLKLKIEDKYFSKVIQVDLAKFNSEQWLNVTVEFQYKIDDEEKVAVNDNYPDISQKPFRFFLTDKELPFPSGWFLGEPHYHSIHTSDQVEFGADIKATKQLAGTMGLDWFFVTDHSYDLDDSEEDYTKNDPELPIWKKMKKAAIENDDKYLRVIAGEEVSIGNSRNRNVHLLAVNHPQFIAGHGDSAERWFHNKPQHKIKEIKRLHSADNLFIAAHPFEKISWLQKLTLRRGNWTEQDFVTGDIKFLQVINSNLKEDILKNIREWTHFLLRGKKYYILAGNDAHGNFNVMRQIQKPFWNLFSSDKQVFGRFFTAVKFHENDPIKAIKNGEMIVSNGPYLNFQLQQKKQLFNIGSSCPHGKAEITYEVATNVEFGKIERIFLHIGDLTTLQETVLETSESGKSIDLPVSGYLRMSLRTEKGALVFTNPIWVV